MAFTWKEKKNIWKGEGIYFITFAVTGRQKLLGNSDDEKDLLHEGSDMKGLE